MPKIQGIEQQFVPGAPQQVRASPDAFGAATGAALQGLGQSLMGLGNVVEDRRARAEMSRLQAAVAEKQAILTTQLSERIRTADPSDSTIAETFLAEAADSLDELYDEVETERGRNYLTATLGTVKAQFMVSATESQAALAGQAAVNNYTTAINAYTTTLVADPSSFPTIIQQIDTAGEEMVTNGTLPRTQELKLRQSAYREAALSAVAGWNEVDPNISRKLINDGAYDQYVDGTTKAQMLGSVDTAERALRMDAELRRTAQERAIKAEREAKLVDMLTRISTGDAANWPQATEIVKSGLSPEQTEHMLRITGQLPQATPGVNPAIRDALMQRALLPPGDPNRLTHEELLSFVYRGIQPEDSNYIMKVLEGGMTPLGQAENEMFDNFWKASRNFLKTTTDINQVDELGDAAFNNFFIWASSEAQRLKDQGTPVADIVDANGPLAKRWVDFKRSMTDASMYNIQLGRFKRGQVEKPPAFPSIPSLSVSGQPKEGGVRSPEEIDRLLRSAE